ncbi:MAG: SIMPL domain-containing protein [Terriglobales bacterium]
MNCKTISVFSVFLFIIASAPFSGAQDCGPRPRLISVTGTSEINVTPDQVVLNLGVESRDKDLGVAKSQSDARVKKILALAHDADVEPKDIETSTLQMGANYSEENVPRFLGYEVSQTTTITLRDLSKYESLMIKLLEAGTNRLDGINFGVSETRKLRDQARSRAIRDAKEKAIAMAAELGQTVGKPWDISEENGWNSYGLAANSFAYDKRAPDANEPTIAPGQVTIKASVKVSFQLE